MDQSSEERLDFAAIVERLKAVVESTEDNVHQQVVGLKNLFYKLQSEECEQTKNEFVANGGNAEDFVYENSYESQFKELLAAYKTKRTAELARREAAQERAYLLKKKVIDDLQTIVDNQDEVDKAFPKVRELQQTWRDAGDVAAHQYNELIHRYQSLLEQFYDFVRISNDLRDLDFKKNLDAKTALCERAEELDKEPRMNVAMQKLQSLHEQWREIGPVARSEREALWERFKAASTVINKKHAAFYQERKNEEKIALQQKTDLCERIKQIEYENVSSRKEWDELTNQITALQAEWKKTGYSARKQANELYERFRNTCDAFFAAKNAYYRKAKDDMREVLAKKAELVEKAEALKDSKAWKETTRKFIELQNEWKTVANVARKKSESLSVRFKAAADAFFAEREKAQNGPEKALRDKAVSKIDKLRAEYNALKSDIQTRENNIGFLSTSSKKDNPLVEQMQAALDKSKARLDTLYKEIVELEKSLRNNDEQNQQ